KAPAAPEHHHDGDMDDDGCEILPAHTVPIGGAGDPPELDAFNQYMHSVLSDGMQVLFVHALKVNGMERIVLAECGPGDSGGGLQFEVLVIEPASLRTLPRVLTRK